MKDTTSTMLQMLRLRPRTNIDPPQTNSSTIVKNLDDSLQIPLSNLYHRGYLSASIQPSFNDEDCAMIDQSSSAETIEESMDDQQTFDRNSLSVHLYKYSRREREENYRRVKRAVRKKLIPPVKTVRTKDSTRIFSDEKHFLIQIPTKIFSRQQISNPSNVIYPLLLDPHFNDLVQLPSHSISNVYFDQMKFFFHWIHSIASQEFQQIITHHDHQHQLSYTPYSIIHLFRQTLLESTQNLKRTFSQSFPCSNEQELAIPPLKIRRYDHSSYEIKNRSTASSSSSGISITQITQPQASQSSDLDRRRSETRPNKLSDHHVNSNSSSMPFHSSNEEDLTIGSMVEQESTGLENRVREHSLTNGQRRTAWSPNSSRETSTQDSYPPKYQSVALNDGARIRIVNCSNDNSKYPSTRSSQLHLNKSSSNQSIDENGSTKTSTRLHTRKSSANHSKTPEIQPISSSSPYPTHTPRLSNSEIARQWSKHSVFYRCHACAHEEFFVVLSRECMRLHVSSQHGNMEENFKQRLSNFLNNQGRALKIFQHYLKWQQPWSEKEIDQLFQLSNVPTTRTNGTL